ncbi:MAG: site-specific DNA-methyltransferase [Armatimonadetes bacterium]|nr:site-specific DNA-methyltransferase [Armatimonadota bacterium]
MEAIINILPETDCILEGDCRTLLRRFPTEHFSACITDPPYNYEFIGRTWNEDEITRRLERIQNSKTLVKNIPYGSGLAGGVRNERWYARNRENIEQYQKWCKEWADELFRTLRPGAYVMVFNSTRTIAHVQVALEDAGFYARDILVWRRHSGIPKGLNFSDKMGKLGDEKAASRWTGWHSCLRNEWEAICLLQKPLLNNYIETIKKSDVGLLHAEDGFGFASNIIDGIGRSLDDKTSEHCTVKPLDLMRYLIRLVVPQSHDHIVLDPFAGTGTTCVAAHEYGVGYVGIDINQRYCEIARERLMVIGQVPTQKALF